MLVNIGNGSFLSGEDAAEIPLTFECAWAKSGLFMARSYSSGDALAPITDDVESDESVIRRDKRPKTQFLLCSLAAGKSVRLFWFRDNV